MKIKKYKSKLIFLDDVDILVSDDRNILELLVQLISFVKSEGLNVKFVFTTTTKDEKKITRMKKKMEYIKLATPGLNECRQFIYKYFYNERESNVDLDSIIEAMQFNIRNIFSKLFMLDDVSKTRSKNVTLVVEDEERILQLYGHADVFETCSTILSNPHYGINDLIVPLSYDPVITSLILYENFREYLHINYMYEPKTYMNEIIRLIHTFTLCEIHESIMFSRCNWDFFLNCCLLKCCGIRVLQTKWIAFQSSYKNKRKQVISYTTIPTRSTQQYCNYRQMKNCVAEKGISIQNMFIMNEVYFELDVKHKNVKKDRKKKSNETKLKNNYIKNICDPISCIYENRFKTIKTMTMIKI
jgi:hypothetical protein